MRQTIDISRDSIKMTVMAISEAVPEKARGFVLAILEKRMTAILERFPDKFFRLTVETFEEAQPAVCKCYDIMAKDSKRHFRGCPQRDESYKP